MITLTKMNKEEIVLNHKQIEHIECIPETKVIMMNHEFFIVKESVEDIIRKIAEFDAMVTTTRRPLTIADRRN